MLQRVGAMAMTIQKVQSSDRESFHIWIKPLIRPESKRSNTAASPSAIQELVDASLHLEESGELRNEVVLWWIRALVPSSEDATRRRLVSHTQPDTKA